jgi:hypothetical protein
MRFCITALVIFIAPFVNAQTRLTPGKNVVNKKWLTSREYQMAWYALKDTDKFEIGTVNTNIISGKKELTVITRVNMKQMKSPWIDSTIADAETLAPVYHSSYNGQRDMVLHFGKVVTGFYTDKIKNTGTTINDTTNGSYFDSNLYPALISWLPLKEEYNQDISIYDYNPNGRIGILKASVKNVTKGVYETKKSGPRNVWVVTVSDEIGGGENGISTYYIDINDRRVWKQEIDAGGRKMVMELLEI